jgi:hypothetical protein
MLGSKPGLLRLWRWQSDVLTTVLSQISSTNSARFHPQIFASWAEDCSVIFATSEQKRQLGDILISKSLLLSTKKLLRDGDVFDLL